MANFFNNSLGRLRLVGLLEGISYLVLLVFSILKRVYDKPELIKVPGMVHGALFVLFVLALIDVHISYKWPIKKTIIAFIASLFPLGNFWADAKLFREDRSL
ncbi:MAG TPA: DUF3817 domain-containing protein [Cytophagales bacterium]|nr:DUF3817 domain-containing protein [Cytophagales bacterium]